MSPLQIALGYLALNLMVVVGHALLGLVRLWQKRWPYLNPRQELRLHHRMLLLIVISLPLGLMVAPSIDMNPLAKVWSPIDGSTYDLSPSLVAVPISGRVWAISNPVKLLNPFLMTLMIFFVSFGVGRFVQQLVRLRILWRGAYLWRKMGKVAIYIHPATQVPLSLWRPGEAMLLLPQSFMERERDRQIALYHELQHHRQRDTLWVYLHTLVQELCCFNPSSFAWRRLTSEVQEYAVDAHLLQHKRITPAVYGDCLIRTAQNRPVTPVYWVAALHTDLQILTRRIKMITQTKRQTVSPRLSYFFSGVVVLMGALLFTTVAIAAQKWVQDRRLDDKKIASLIEQAKTQSKVELMANPAVVLQLNRYLGTAEGRIFMRQGIERMAAHEASILAAATKHQLPAEILAVPLIESGYENLPQGKNPQWGAGIWMFIKPTAIKYGLKVEGSTDDRQDIGKETDAAMRLFTDLKQQFQSWELALLAYNIGAKRLNEVIQKTGSRDVWKLISAGAENDPDYFAKWQAAVIILANRLEVFEK